MAIFKDDWGVARVEKELLALRKEDRKRYRAPLDLITRFGGCWSERVELKIRQLERAKENWRLWSTDPVYQLAIADFIYGMAMVNFPFRK